MAVTAIANKNGKLRRMGMMSAAGEEQGARAEHGLQLVEALVG
jgi:hypothetical protein